MGATRLGRETGLTITEANEFIDRDFAFFPAVRTWIDKTLEDARKTGYVETLLSMNKRVEAMARNAAVNTPVQGSAADIIKRATIDLEAALGESPLAAELLLQVHDELVLEVPLVVDFGHG